MIPSLRELICADIYRDGGSYGAEFKTEDGKNYHLWLQVIPWDRPGNIKHSHLYGYLGHEHQRDWIRSNVEPIKIGSDDEAALLLNLRKLFNEQQGIECETSDRFGEMIDAIPKRRAV